MTNCCNFLSWLSCSSTRQLSNACSHTPKSTNAFGRYWPSNQTQVCESLWQFNAFLWELCYEKSRNYRPTLYKDLIQCIIYIVYPRDPASIHFFAPRSVNMSHIICDSGPTCTCRYILLLYLVSSQRCLVSGRLIHFTFFEIVSSLSMSHNTASRH